VLLFDDEQVDAVPFGSFANIPGFFQIGRIDRSIHSESVEYAFGLIDQLLGFGNRHELGQVGLAQLVDIVQFAVGKQSGAADTAQNIAGFALHAFLFVVDRTLALQWGFAFFDNEHLKVGVFAQIIGGKQAGRTSTHNDDVVINILGHMYSLANAVPDIS